MGPRDALAFTQRVKALCTVFRSDYTPSLDDAYFRAVEDMDAAQVTKALDVLETTSKFLPKPVELREAALAAADPSLARRCPAGATLFQPRYRVSVASHGIVATIGEHGGFAIREGAKWTVFELTGPTGDGRRELWSGGPTR